MSDSPTAGNPASGIPDPQEAIDAAIAALCERTAQDEGTDGMRAARWHALVAVGAAAAVIRQQEREHIISLASQLRASFPADHPVGAQASFADYLRVTSAGAGEDGNESA